MQEQSQQGWIMYSSSSLDVKAFYTQINFPVDTFVFIVRASQGAKYSTAILLHVNSMKLIDPHSGEQLNTAYNPHKCIVNRM